MLKQVQPTTSHGQSRPSCRSTHVDPFADDRVVALYQLRLRGHVPAQELDRRVPDGRRAVIQSVLDRSSDVDLREIGSGQPGADLV